MKNHFKKTRLSELGEIARGVTYKSPDDLRPADSPRTVQLLRATNIQDGAITLDDVQVIDEACAPDRQRLAPGDIAICIANGSRALVGKAALVDVADPEDYVVGAFCARFRPRQGESPDLIAAIFESQEYRSWIDRLLGTTTINNLKPSDIANCPIMLPTEERGRRRLGELMRTSRNALRYTDALIDAKREQKRGLMQQLLTGKVRFPGFTEPWKTVRLGDVAHEVSERNKGQLAEQDVCGVIKGAGLMPMRERVMSDDLTRYLVVSPKSFAYNPMRLNIGSIAFNSSHKRVLVSPDYVVFSTRPTALSPNYLNHVRSSWIWEKFVQRAGSGSVRTRIYFDDLATLKLPLPEAAEQDRIDGALRGMDSEIQLLVQQREALANQRRGLMERLLSGEIDIPSSDTSAA